MPGEKKKEADRDAIVKAAGTATSALAKLQALIPEHDTKNTAHLADAVKAVNVCSEDYEG